ncbi:Manganese/iron superoxide dismutase [Gloeopeniophorella convolvens]|nr:Manganese/iron superoxide dismutase [Gloeopeniophorella convolvens]
MHRLARSLAAARRVPRATRLASAAAASSRGVHVRVPLPYKIEDGMGDFLPPAALKLVAEDFQQGLLDRLNEQTKGTQLEHLSVAQIVISTAPHASQTLAFNYASLALNNSFFLHHLKAPPAGRADHEAELDAPLPTERTQTLRGAIATSFGSLQELKDHVAAAARGLAASGFVWLVTDAHGRLGVVATHAAGTLLAADRRQDAVELGGVYQPAAATEAHGSLASAPPASPASGLAPPPPRAGPPTGARALSTAVRTGAPRATNVWAEPGTGAEDAGVLFGADGGVKLDELGRALYPLFCVSVHEHAWLAAGYGVWGKDAYLARFWSCLDWAAVRGMYARYGVPRAGGTGVSAY